jgi:hypothetical protein
MMMLRKSLLMLTAFSLLLHPGTVRSDDTSSSNPALKLMALYSPDIKSIKMINPYIVNIIAIYEINDQKDHLGEVKDYIQWYFDHVNYPDKDGLTGSIYDYAISDSGELKSSGHYDSVDGYAGTFLYMLNLYCLQTGDKELISANWEKIKDIAYLMQYLQGEDGLTIPYPKSKDNVKYLMDNCEAYAGIKAYNNLAERTGMNKEPFFLELEINIKKAILNNLSNKAMKNFYWAVDDKVKHISDWKILYPDALAQISAIFFGILDEDVDKRKSFWNEFNKYHGKSINSFPAEQLMIYKLTKKKMLEQSLN